MKQKLMTFERLMSRSFGKESFSFWRGTPRGLRLDDVQQYLRDGGDPNHRTEDGRTLLHIAADNQQIGILRLLASHGADLNAKAYQGWTPLHFAVDADCDTSARDGRRASELPTTQAPLELGADESIRIESGETPRDVAAAYGTFDATLYDTVARSVSERAIARPKP
jgi:uncharacterized protein